VTSLAPMYHLPPGYATVLPARALPAAQDCRFDAIDMSTSLMTPVALCTQLLSIKFSGDCNSCELSVFLLHSSIRDFR
jgi:hypothetical protein